ncbi:GNAT family N-acetyltransferase [Sphingobacterium sp. SYP-B4668]|uniref:GNAT family N-acetyltransferase n=1 Tax=Sphingobacterium sp. SYP-B4668 TaxID=2996035 RepID=UPI0005325FBE|nr:GNAT family N-acetyltransferase [Sphingobacterium sp. SYP-B4668]
MDIKQTSNGRNGVFTAYLDGQQSGQIHYYEDGEDKLIIESTDVGDHFSGHGIGKKLILEVVDYARRNEMKIIPQCPFARSIFEKTIAFQDVLDTEE